MASVAVTDHGNMFGTIDFYKKAKDAGHQADLRLRGLRRRRPSAATRPSGQELPPHPAGQERRGLREPPATSTPWAFLDGFYYHPRIDKKVLKEHSKGLIGLTACLGGEVTQPADARGRRPWPRSAALEYK